MSGSTMLRKNNLVGMAAVLIGCFLAQSVFARVSADLSDRKQRENRLSTMVPAEEIAEHNIGLIQLAVANNGSFGKNYNNGLDQDAFTGADIGFSCQYPKNSRIEYLYGGAFWIGAVLGRDTLVSVGHDGWSFEGEMFPDEAPFGKMVYRSITDPTKPEFMDAISEQDYIAVYTDTCIPCVPDNDYFGRPHVPLNIEVTQRSFAWSYAYAEDFILFDYLIKNIGSRELTNVYMGVYVDADVCFDCQGTNQGFADDLCGFLHTYPATYGACTYDDTVFIAWIADNDGDFTVVYESGLHPTPNVSATRIVRTPSHELEVSFNWWIGNGNAALDFGPRERANQGVWQEDWRDYGTGGLGTPEGDVNKYYVLRNKEFDYDQAFTASIQPNDPLWLYPNQELAGPFTMGYDTRYLLSFGPFDIRPGQTLPISFSYVAGGNFHKMDGNLANLPDHPGEYYANLSFADLALNSTWSSWVYDNPGVDTDDDKYFGRAHYCTTYGADDEMIIEEYYYEGDGVPDFRGASPPPPPDFWIEPSVGKLSIRFNGLRSETTEDVFSRSIDFEGYRVYLARDLRPASYMLVASYDQENYNKFVYNPNRTGSPGYQLYDVPFTIDQLRCLYGDSCGDPNFDPESYSRSSPYIHPDFPDSMFIFIPQDFNVSELGVETPIRKIYPGQPRPATADPDSGLPGELTEDGYFKYYEYRIDIVDLLPTVSYFVNVTAFDYGSPVSGLTSLETAVTLGAQEAYPLSSWQDVESGDLKVYVYPNPYRIDDVYRERGFEGRTELDRPPDRTRAIHFANLPPRCTIRIFTVDGDLVREIEHNAEPSDAMATHESWNLITRNTQLIVSGMYYWTVEDEDGGVQVGKLVVIM